MFCLWPRNKATEFWMLVRHPLGRRNWNSKGPASRPCWQFFFDSQGIVHKEFIPEGKTVNAEFYKGVMDCLLKRIQWVRPAAFCSRDFFLLHDNAPAHKVASVCKFFTQKNVTTLYHPPVLSRFISARLFSVPQVQNTLKRTPNLMWFWPCIVVNMWK